MNQRVFTSMCKSHGYARISPHYYARCIGDGILQTIYTGHRRYIDPSSPAYSSINRKSNYVSIGLYSMYTPWEEDLFAPGVHLGEFSPSNFILPPSNHYKFMGIESEYVQMRDSVLSTLDTITTQEEYLDFYSHSYSYLKSGRKHNVSLVAPFLMCNRIDDALLELCYHYMFCREHVRNMFGPTNEGYNFPQYQHEDLKMLEKLAPWICIWDARLKRKSDAIQEWLYNNYDRNIAWVGKYQIPVVNGAFKRDIHIKL